MFPINHYFRKSRSHSPRQAAPSNAHRIDESIGEVLQLINDMSPDAPKETTVRFARPDSTVKDDEPKEDFEEEIFEGGRHKDFLRNITLLDNVPHEVATTSDALSKEKKVDDAKVAAVNEAFERLKQALNILQSELDARLPPPRKEKSSEKKRVYEPDPMFERKSTAPRQIMHKNRRLREQDAPSVEIFPSSPPPDFEQQRTEEAPLSPQNDDREPTQSKRQLYARAEDREALKRKAAAIKLLPQAPPAKTAKSSTGLLMRGRPKAAKEQPKEKKTKSAKQKLQPEHNDDEAPLDKEVSSGESDDEKLCIEMEEEETSMDRISTKSKEQKIVEEKPSKEITTVELQKARALLEGTAY